MLIRLRGGVCCWMCRDGLTSTAYHLYLCVCNSYCFLRVITSQICLKFNDNKCFFPIVLIVML